MTNTTTFAPQTYEEYHLVLDNILSGQAIRELIALLRTPPQRKSGALSGRAGVGAAAIDGLGRVVVKHYERGGVFSYLVRRHYLRLGEIRPQREAEILQTVRSLGVKAPRPIGYAWKGRLFYRGWLFLEEVEHHKSLAEVSLAPNCGLRALISELAGQVQILIKNGILHIDLHPGNVLVNDSGRIFLIDFDKALYCRRGAEYLRDQYLCRWRRAVIKHELPEELSEMMSLELRRS